METRKKTGVGPEAGNENEWQNTANDPLPDGIKAPRYCSSYCVIVTVEREYHLVEDVCAGVRERGSGRWLVGHRALNLRIGGAVRNGSRLPAFFPGVPRVGEAMWFEAVEEPLQTEPVLGIEYPAGIAREFLLQLTFRAAVCSTLDSSTDGGLRSGSSKSGPRADRPVVVISAPVELEDAGAAAGKPGAEGPWAEDRAARAQTVNLKPRRPNGAAKAPAVSTEKIFNFFSHILMPATP